MARRLLSFLGCAAMVSFATISLAQPAGRDIGGSDPRHFDAAEYGDHVIVGPNWLFAAGDNPGWASADFDDTGWQTVSSERQLLEYGIRDISHAWYRMHVHLPAGARNLMVGLTNVSGQYEIFANGSPIGGFGSMAGSRMVGQGELIGYAVPDNLIQGRGDLVVAMRFALSPAGYMGRGTSTPFGPFSVMLIGRESAAHESS